ncbi:Sensor kinase CckA [Methylobacterium crusticola]|uniref:histidine kinase n=1 Tax=Methylobacterium crusticola TaxID=1697972 RepID=A0ABQ4QVB7_9HYPH|nr:response regulator [Methylobacterium crusticola]GJD48845.1 Sensor kinase CckA [Methylobacterium crusticola]
MPELSHPAAEAALDRSERPGRVSLLLLLAGLLVGAAVGLSFVANDQAQPIILGLLALLAMAGVFCLFALAIGAIQLTGQGTRNDVTKAVVDAAPDGMIAVEDGNRPIYANAAYLAVAGSDTFSNLRPVERVFMGSPEVSEAVYRLAQAAREGRSLSEEIRMAPPPGGAAERDFAWYRIAVRPLPLARRPVALWSVSDITHERERQENVFQELQHAIDYLDHAPAGFLSIDPRGAVVYMNATLASWLGHDLAQVGSGGLRLAEILPGELGEVLVGGKGQPGEVRTDRFDLDLRRRNGHPLSARLYHRVAYGQDGRPGASRTLVLNRSAGEENDDPRRAAEVRFDRFFNTSPVAVATLAPDGRVMRANASFARLFGTLPRTSDGSEVGPPVRDFVAERDRPNLEAGFRLASEGRGDVPPVEIAVAAPGNRSARIWLSPEGRAVGAAAEGAAEAVILYALDTTDQHQLQQQINQAQKMEMVGQLAGGIAHDFNNVLQAIIGYSDLLLASHRPTDPAFQDIMQIKQNANRAASLVRQLLAFSRRQTLRPEVIHLGEALSDLTLLLKRLLGERVELDLKHGRDLWPVKADVNQFEQVIVNLAVNARDAMPTGGRLLIRTANVAAEAAGALQLPGLPAADCVLVEVTDTGTGMTPEVMEKIFEPFFTTKEVNKGTGLGLSTVFGIVKQSGGYIDVRSTMGQGTVFAIYLPRHVPVPEAEPAEAPPAGQSPPVPQGAPPAKPPARDLTGHGTILLVEDEDPVRAVNARALTARGYTVLEAASGLEALQIMAGREVPVDLVVSDVVMPEMDGPTLLRELRKAHPDLRVIFVSGYAEDAFRKNLPEGEEFNFLPKPFSLKQLVETVKTTMAG